MGIKGIYNEIGPGERVALTKFAIEKFEKIGRPLRIAIDVSIWQFQIQAGRGGSDPATRTLYYRLQRLLSHSIHPLFVFDGPHKPPVKRNKRTGAGGGSVSNLLTKKLLKLFGFPYHMAPGEAEAECALLQREGIVDAVLSEDVDTLMFGSTLTLRNWSSEGPKSNKSPTHVNIYDAKATKEGNSGLDREGMILVALMSGGDYDTDGIPGCGIKVACEAARAGYGKSLCMISRLDTTGYKSWRNDLAEELASNKSKYFKTKHKTLHIPENFPNRDILGYYTHPVVSTASKIQQLKEGINWDAQVDVVGLRAFVAEAFEWTYKSGCRKFIRGIAPALLVQKLRSRANRRDSEYGDLLLTKMNETELVQSICGSRKHFDTDALPELRLVFIPIEIVGLNLEEEEDTPDIEYGRDGLAPRNEDDEVEEYVSDAETSRSASPIKRAASIYDPTKPDKVWVSHTIAKIGIPLKVEDYEEALRNPRKAARPKAASKKVTTKGGMPKGAMDRFVKISKPTQTENSISSKTPSKTAPSTQALPPVFLTPALEENTSSEHSSSTKLNKPSRASRTLRSARSGTDMMPVKSPKGKSTAAAKPKPNTNPWTIAHSPVSTDRAIRITKPSTTHHILNSSPPAPLSKPSSPLQATSLSELNLLGKNIHALSFSSSSSQELEEETSLLLPSNIRVTRGKTNAAPTSAPTQNMPTERNRNRPTRKRHSPSPDQNSRNQATLGDAVSSKSPLPILDLSSHSENSTSSPLEPPTPTGIGREIITLDSSPLSIPIMAIRVPTKTMGVEEKELSVDLKGKKKKFFVARESLPGAFKVIEEDEEMAKAENGVRDGARARGNNEGRWRMSLVEMVDLSGD